MVRLAQSGGFVFSSQSPVIIQVVTRLCIYRAALTTLSVLPGIYQGSPGYWPGFLHESDTSVLGRLLQLRRCAPIALHLHPRSQHLPAHSRNPQWRYITWSIARHLTPEATTNEDPIAVPIFLAWGFQRGDFVFSIQDAADNLCRRSFQHRHGFSLVHAVVQLELLACLVDDKANPVTDVKIDRKKHAVVRSSIDTRTNFNERSLGRMSATSNSHVQLSYLPSA
ncbi:unnamed protein product [Phytophthora fragariaefolia]|uniref:Unnamed protein product n=1 Tax=Phytophthora fragariaefolia TaxID=1490495 RepID=A0A9W6XYW7_9STRA|nr:unnamed protein product [Phytophthora fragariaefolia]